MFSIAYRQTGMADRRAAGASLERAGRSRLEDAAHTIKAGAVRPAGRARGGPERPDAGDSQGGDRDRQRLRSWRAVHAAVRSAALSRCPAMPAAPAGPAPRSIRKPVRCMSEPIAFPTLVRDPEAGSMARVLRFIGLAELSGRAARHCRCSSRRSAAWSQST